MATQTSKLSPAQRSARRKNSCKSTGPRSCRGKRRSSRNALRHGLYSDVHYFYWDAAMELGEDPHDFYRLYTGLLAARPPADTLEQVLVEDLAVLIWKKARLERSESAVQVCNVRQHDLERRRQYIQVGRDVTSMAQAEVLEKGLRVTLDAPGKFEKVLVMLGMLEDLTERNEFNQDMHNLLLALYGKQPTMRGVGLLNQFVKLRKLRQEGQEFEDAKAVFEAMLAEEHTDVIDDYGLFLQEHVENTRAARIAAMAPSHAQWAAIIRQQNALHRQMERKIRLLDEMQERRRKLGSAQDLLAGLRNRVEGPGGGGPAPTTTPNPSSGEEGSRVGPAPIGPGATAPGGVAHTSRGLASGCMRLSPPTGQERDADMPESGTSAPPLESRGTSAPPRECGGTSAPPPESGGTSAAPPAGTISPRPFGGEGPEGEGVQEATREHPQGFPPRRDENTENRGNEAKKSLKTNEVAPTNCAIQTRFGARNARNEAQKSAFQCTRRRSHHRKLQPLTATVIRAPGTAVVWGPRIRQSVA